MTLLIGVLIALRLGPRLNQALARRLSSPALRGILVILAVTLAIEAGRAGLMLLANLLFPAAAPAPALSALPSRVLADAAGLALIALAARAWPRRWWLVLGVPAALVVTLWTLVSPLALPPLARGDRAVAQGGPILAFAQTSGFATQTLFVHPGRDPGDIDLESLGPIRHLAVSQAASAAPTEATFAALGHIRGHDRHHDLWSLAALQGAAVLIGLYLIHRLTGPLIRRLGRTAVVGAGDPAAAPAVALIAWVCAILYAPVFDLFDQAINYRADAYALSLTHDPAALCRWLIATEAGSKADPSPLEAVLFYDHPPLQARLTKALQWRAGSPP